MLSGSSKLTVFRERSSRKTVRFSEQVVFTVGQIFVFSRHMEAVVYTPSKVEDVCRTNISKPSKGKWITWRITKLHYYYYYYYCSVLHVLIDNRQSNPLESIKMSTFILWWNLEQMWKHGLFDASSVCECSSDTTRVKTFLTGIGALRENAKDDDPLFSSSPSSMSHACGVITEETLIWLIEKQRLKVLPNLF